MSAPVLEFDLHFARPGFSLAARAEFAAGVTGLRGPSGAGKSTLLRILAGLLRPSRGFLRWRGPDTAETLVDVAGGIFVPPWQRHFGVVFQEGLLFPHLDVLGNLRFGLPDDRPGRRRFEPEPIIGMLELAPLLRRRPHELSGGERQRVALGRALLQSPRLLLLDEPLAALDDRLKEQILPYLEQVRDVTGVAMVYVSHAPAELDRLAGTQYVMERGCLRLL